MSEINYEKRIKELRKHIFDCNDFPVEEVKVPEWKLPFPIYIRTMSAQERDTYEANQLIDDGKGEGNKIVSLKNMRTSLLVAVLCADPEGKHRIFNSKEDIIALGKKSVAAVDRCLDVSRKLNGSTEEDEENLVKNLTGQEEASG